MPMSVQTISITCRALPWMRSISKPMRISSAERNVWASAKKAHAAMHQAVKSSPAGMSMPSGRPADSDSMMTKMATRKTPPR
jgi:hypothetical protein